MPSEEVTIWNVNFLSKTICFTGFQFFHSKSMSCCFKTCVLFRSVSFGRQAFQLKQPDNSDFWKASTMAHRRVPQFCAFGRPENLGTDGLNLLGVSCGSCPPLVAAPPAQSAASSDRAGVYTRLDRAVAAPLLPDVRSALAKDKIFCCLVGNAHNSSSSDIGHGCGLISS